MSTKIRRCRRCGKLFVHGAIKCECGCEEFLIVGMAPEEQQHKAEPDWIEGPELENILKMFYANGR